MASVTTQSAPQCGLTTFAPAGHYAASGTLGGPGLVLAGSGLTMPPAVFHWIHTRLGFGSARRGNVVVLRATGDNYYDRPFYRRGDFASVRTVVVPHCAPRAVVDSAARYVNGADAVFFSGGDQANYAAWKGSKLISAVKALYARRGIVGGGSAGLAIQGAVVYDAVAADRWNNDTHTADAVKYPLERRISFTTNFFAWPALARTITDTHFVARDRFGRLVVFLARISHDGLLPPDGSIYGLGVDQESAVVVDPDGIGTVVNTGKGHGAYLLRAPSVWHGTLRAPIHFTVLVSHMARAGETFDLLRKRTSEPWYSVTVNGASKQIYSRNPY
ncbi:MAG: hypothetical protein JO135_01420 [Candidatus Eremiobacteraeota bacterium]|nr:hypothetical protein [Candidatus Eremiobacteraeota bacterium]